MGSSGKYPFRFLLPPVKCILEFLLSFDRFNSTTYRLHDIEMNFLLTKVVLRYSISILKPFHPIHCAPCHVGGNLFGYYNLQHAIVMSEGRVIHLQYAIVMSEGRVMHLQHAIVMSEGRVMHLQHAIVMSEGRVMHL